MKTLIASFSLTGNNTLLAQHLAVTLGADHEEIIAQRKMGNLALALDALFNRTPAIATPIHTPSEYSLVIVVGPIWMGKIASAIRSYLKRYRKDLQQVAFISICGGALGRNPSVPSQVERVLGTKPVAVTQLYINDLLDSDQQGDSKATSAYRVTQEDLETGWKPQLAEFFQAIR